MIRRIISSFCGVLMASTCMAQTMRADMSDGNTLCIKKVAENAVRVTYLPQGTARTLPELVYTDVTQTSEKKTKSLGKMKLKGGSLSVDKTTGKINLVREGKREPVFILTSYEIGEGDVQSTPTLTSKISFDSPADEFISGLGQFQDGQNNLKGVSRRLTQVNTQISVPMIISSEGYGLLWNNYGLTEYNPSDHHLELLQQNEPGEEQTVNQTSTNGNQVAKRQYYSYTGMFETENDGDYSFLLDIGQKMAKRHFLVIDGDTVVNLNNIWLPPTTTVNKRLEKGSHIITCVAEKNDKPSVFYRRIDGSTTFYSPVSEGIDFTLFVGSPDEIIASYRTLTGAAPMMPLWAMGYIHCRERFRTQESLLATAKEFRQRQIPVDMIVQDWQYWPKNKWNAMEFDAIRYPAPHQMVDSLHKMDMRLMLSVWSKIAPDTEVGKKMEECGYYIPGTQWIDFFNPSAASAYWESSSKNLLQPYGIDAWWQDATEPENDDLLGRRVANGQYAGETFRNIYPIMVNKTVWEGLRRDQPSKRSMILTRCGFSGIQRFGAALWSGDVGHDFKTLRTQISAGLGLMSAGIPWWTYDAGGFFRPSDQYTSKTYHEQLLRWLEVSTFLPLMRVHGYISDTEPWNYGEEVEKVFTRQIQLRYMLLPYIYSYNYEIHAKGGSLMRPLLFDFANDKKALQQPHEYMFGRSLLVSPVVEAGECLHTTYLPETPSGWYDLWTGSHEAGGKNVTDSVMIDRIPVYVRGGSILPLAQGDMQHSGQLNDVMVKMMVYPGKDADFDLYYDDGVSFAYEEGAYQLIPLHWNDKKQELTIGNAMGKGYEGMPQQRTICVCKIGKDDETKEVVYVGKAIKIKFQ